MLEGMGYSRPPPQHGEVTCPRGTARRSPRPTAPGAGALSLPLHFGGEASARTSPEKAPPEMSHAEASHRREEAKRHLSRVPSAEDYAVVVLWKAALCHGKQRLEV